MTYCVCLLLVSAANADCPRCEMIREQNKNAPSYECYEDYLEEQKNTSNDDSKENTSEVESDPKGV